MKKRNHKKGQSLIEFALLLPILLIVIMGLFDIGRAIFYYSVLNTAAREGSRYAIVQPVCNYKGYGCTGADLDTYPVVCGEAVATANIEICDVVTDRLFSISELSSSVVTINHIVSATNDPMVTIDIEFLFNPVTPGLGLISNLTLHVNSQMLMTPIAIE
jgi:hypothetical protein